MIVIAYLHVNLFRIYGKDTATELNNEKPHFKTADFPRPLQY